MSHLRSQTRRESSGGHSILDIVLGLAPGAAVLGDYSCGKGG